MRRIGPNLLILALMLVVPAAGLASTENRETFQYDTLDGEFGDESASGDFGRLRHIENGVTVRRSYSDPEAGADREGSLNAPVRPGDTVRTASNQRVEVELAGGSLVRVDRGTELYFQALPDPYLEVRDNTILALSDGTIRVAAFVGEKETFRIDTPAASVYIIGDADIRIEVGNHGRTVVSSWRGVAEIAGDGGSILVRAGMRAEAFPGSYPADPGPFNTLATDSFDRWVLERDRAYQVNDRYAGGAVAETYEELPYEVRPYYRELSSHGRWVRTRDYGWCWYPYDVATGWRPYQDGYWDYGPSGYFWVSHEPWGWAPYHYGRWDWVTGYGWCWIPGRVFGGAWVAWSWGSLHIGWSPLNYWNRPVYFGGSLYYDYYCPHSWTFIRYDHFHHRHYRRYAVPVGRIGHGLRGRAVLTRPPRARPRDIALDRGVRDRWIRDARDRSAKIRIRKPGDPGEKRTGRRRFREDEDRLIRRGEIERRRASIDRRKPREGERNRPVTPVARGGRSGDPGRKEIPRPGNARGPSDGRKPGGSGARPGTPVRTPGRDTAAVPDTTRRPTPFQRSRVLTGRGRGDDEEARPAPGAERRTGDARRSTGGSAGRRPDRSAGGAGSRRSAPAAPAERPRRIGGEKETGERVRDMYRRYSQPRTTRRTGEERSSSTPRTAPRGDTSGSGSSGGTSPRREPARSGSSGRSQPRRESTGAGSSGRSQPRRQPSRSGSSGKSQPRRESSTSGSSGRSQPRRESSRSDSRRRSPDARSYPRVSTPRTTPRSSSPRVSTPRSTQRPSSPRVSTPRRAPSRSSTPRASSPRSSSRPSSPRVSTPRSAPKPRSSAGRSSPSRSRSQSSAPRRSGGSRSGKSGGRDGKKR